VKCQVSLEAPSSIDAAGGKNAVTVSAQPECSWTASSDAAWISGLAPSSGQGSGRVEFQAAANTSSTMRQGHIAVNGQQVPLQQQPAPCRYDVSPAAPSIDAGGGTVTLSVTTATGCSWQASVDAGWVSITTTSGTGSGNVALRVAPNGGETRSASLLVAGRTVTLTQSSPSSAIPGPSPSPSPSTCVFSLQRANETIGAAGGPVTVAVTGTSGCARTAISNATWIAVVAGASGSGGGSVTFNVAANSGAARTGTLTIAGQLFTVVQSAPAASACTFSIGSNGQAVGADGRDGVAVTVSTAAGCAWTATSNAGWITLVSGGSGAGAGTVKFNVAGNTGAARTGTLTIAGQLFTVDQASGCTYAINPREQQIGDAGGSVTVAVSAGAGCAWTAKSNVSWITVTQGATGSGNGTVQFNVEAQAKKRTGTLTIAGLEFKVVQDK